MSEPPEDPTVPGWIEPPPEVPRTITPSGARRVAPNPDRPRLSPRREAVAAAAHALSAEGYDALEAAGDRAATIAEAIRDGEVQAELVIDDSTVFRIATERKP